MRRGMSPLSETGYQLKMGEPDTHALNECPALTPRFVLAIYLLRRAAGWNATRAWCSQ